MQNIWKRPSGIVDLSTLLLTLPGEEGMTLRDISDAWCYIWRWATNRWAVVVFSCSVVSDSLQPQGRQHASVLHHLPELAQAHVLPVGDTIQPSHSLSSPSPPAFSLSQHQGLSKGSDLCIRWQSIGTSASAAVLPILVHGVYCIFHILLEIKKKQICNIYWLFFLIAPIL